MIGPVRILLSASGEAGPAGGALSLGPLRKLFGEQLIISRARCSFHAPRNMDGLSGERLSRALYLEAQAAAPYADAGVFIDIRGSRACVWTWDAQAVRRDAGMHKRHSLPETVLHAPVEGFALRRCVDGNEGQFWRDQALLLSRWWPEQPDDAQWRLFCLSAENLGAAPEPLPIAQKPHLRETPSNRLAMRDRLAGLRRSEIIAVAALLLTPMATYAAGRSFTLVETEAGLAQKYRQMRQIGLDNRRNMAELRTAVAEINRLGDFFTPNPLPAMADAIGQIMTVPGMVVERVRFDKGDFTIRLRTKENFSQPDLVGALEALPHIDNVRIEEQSSGRRWSLHFSITSARAVAPVDARG